MVLSCRCRLIYVGSRKLILWEEPQKDLIFELKTQIHLFFPPDFFKTEIAYCLYSNFLKNKDDLLKLECCFFRNLHQTVTETLINVVFMCFSCRYIRVLHQRAREQGEDPGGWKETADNAGNLHFYSCLHFMWHLFAVGPLHKFLITAFCVSGSELQQHVRTCVVFADTTHNIKSISISYFLNNAALFIDVQ